MSRKPFFALAASVLFWSTSLLSGGSNAAELIFGIGPQQSPTELAKRWVPVIQYLSEAAGVPMRFITARDIPTFQQEMQAGTYDLAYINPVHYTLFNRVAGYRAFAKEQDGKLVGVLVARRGNVHTLEQLHAKTVAFPSASAIAATLLPMAHLAEKNIAVTPQYVVSMDSVYRAVAKGLFPAGGGEMRTLGTIDPEIRDQLEVIWRADPLPPFAFAAHPRTSPTQIAKVLKAMEEMSHDARGASLLKSINFKGIVAASDADYAALRDSKLLSAIAK